MPDGRRESTKGIEALVFLKLKINKPWLIGLQKKGPSSVGTAHHS
jgi:hypothetical protein